MSIQKYLFLIVALVGTPAWPQVDPAANSSTEAGAGDRMVAPPPVSGEAQSMVFAAETPRTNYLSMSLGFTGAYDDNILPGTTKIGDASYSFWPKIILQQSRSRLRWDLSYSPGFTFYQKHDSLNQDDHNLGLNVEYRLSPHVTLSLGDSFQKASTVLSLFDPTVASSGQGVVVAPVTNLVSNHGNAMITYQFGLNGMIGAKGGLSQLRYPNSAEAPGLFDSTAQTAGGFYTHRLTRKHYIGVNYDFQRLLARPIVTGQTLSETQAHSLILSYTLYLQPTVSVSVFAGPEYSDTQTGTFTSTPTAAPFRMWSPATGASFAWQGARTSLAVAYARKLAAGGGLSGASRSNSANASIRRQLTTNLAASVGANYTTSDVLDSASSSGTKGHIISGTAALEHSVSEHLNLQIGYTRLHQSYSNILVPPDRNRGWASLSYQFTRPLGR